MTSPTQKDSERKEQLERLRERLGVPFHDLSLLDVATTHKSYGSEYGVEDYERLEFFGDAVLKFVIAEFLFSEFPGKPEGFLTEILNVLVSGKTLGSLGKSFGLDEFIRSGKAVVIKQSFIAQSMEAILGALYLDSNFTHVRAFIVKHIGANAEELSRDSVKANYKSLLQEYTQARAQGIPKYSVVRQDGPPHDPTFVIAVIVGEQSLAEGEGSSKQVAEQAAARAAMQKLTGKMDL